MGEKIQSAYDNTVFWSPGIMRGAIVVILSMLTVLMSQMENVTEEKAAAMGWVSWIKFFVPIALAGLITLKGFLDDTMSKLREKHDTVFMHRDSIR